MHADIFHRSLCLEYYFHFWPTQHPRLNISVLSARRPNWFERENQRPIIMLHHSLVFNRFSYFPRPRVIKLHLCVCVYDYIRPCTNNEQRRYSHIIAITGCGKGNIFKMKWQDVDCAAVITVGILPILAGWGGNVNGFHQFALNQENSLLVSESNKNISLKIWSISGTCVSTLHRAMQVCCHSNLSSMFCGNRYYPMNLTKNTTRTLLLVHSYQRHNPKWLHYIIVHKWTTSVMKTYFSYKVIRLQKSILRCTEYPWLSYQYLGPWHFCLSYLSTHAIIPFDPQITISTSMFDLISFLRDHYCNLFK